MGLTINTDRSFLDKVFFSPDERRLRAGWRLLIQTILIVFIALVLSLIFSGVLIYDDQPYLSRLSSQIIELLAVGGSIYIARRFIDKRSFTSLGLNFNRQALIDLLLGIAIPGIMMGFIFLVEWSIGWLSFDGFAWQVYPTQQVFSNALLVIFIFMLVGWNEELLSRGYHLQTIASGTNLAWGIFLSSAVFGVLHLGNPGATWISAAGILFAGLFLAYGYLRTGQLWLSIGLHIGWNYFEGTVFGFPVSGFDFYSLTLITVDGPVLWTGGDFGPEAGLIVLPALLLGTLLIRFVTRDRNPALPSR
ncbi:MAG: type II CAAX endopeptidase family protein [Chloroflexota bacterium]